MSGAFKGHLDIRYIPLQRRPWWLWWLPRRREWVLRHAFTWCGDDGLCVLVPKGTKTDFASIPWLIRLVLGPMNGLLSDYGRSAVVHDELYQRGVVSRATADAILYAAMRSESVLWLTANVIWAGVRIGGWVAYRRYRRAEFRTQ